MLNLFLGYTKRGPGNAYCRDRLAGISLNHAANTTNPFFVLLVVNGITTFANDCKVGLEFIERGDGGSSKRFESVLAHNAFNLSFRQVRHHGLAHCSAIG